MERITVELAALGFQAVVTILLALVYLGLSRRPPRPDFAAWSLAWFLYACRLGAISAFLITRDMIWLFVHQALTGLVALLLLWAALHFSRGTRWRRRYAWLAVAAVVWAYAAVFWIRDLAVSGISTAVLLAGVTLWTGVEFWRYRARHRSGAATVLAVTFMAWGLHHLDYPLFRSLGAGVLFGVFVDVLFIMAAAVGMLFLVLSERRHTLEARSAQLEQLTRLLLRAQEDERRRIARELHDEAGQVLTAVKIELDLDGRKEASAMVGRALAQVRDLGNLLRPVSLDELGLVPALRGLVDDFSRRTRIEASLECPESPGTLSPEHQLTVYRVVQEALTNVARHAGASRARVRLESSADRLRLEVEDDGRGALAPPTPNLGLLGMRERVTALGGALSVGNVPGKGFRIEAIIPMGAAT